MSTLEYLDHEGSVKNFSLVPWERLHSWLSISNGNSSASSFQRGLPKGVNRGKILEELEARRNMSESVGGFVLRSVGLDRGIGKDWREYEEEFSGLTHLEELLVFQPTDWKKQA